MQPRRPTHGSKLPPTTSFSPPSGIENPRSLGRKRPLPYKPDSVPPAFAGFDDHFSPRRSGSLPKQAATITRGVTGGQPILCSVLHRAGFTVPPLLPSARWALTPPFHPYLFSCEPSAVYSLLHFPSRSFETPVPRFHEARCPMVSGLSSTLSLRKKQRSPGERRRKANARRSRSKAQWRWHALVPQTQRTTPATICHCPSRSLFNQSTARTSPPFERRGRRSSLNPPEKHP